MKSSAKKVELASVDDLFSTEESRADAGREKVVEIPLSELHSFKGHPFKVKDDDAMMETADSIRQYGVLVPAIARPDPSGGYELVAGHRRHRASELAEKETMPVIVRDLDDDAATIIMVERPVTEEPPAQPLPPKPLLEKPLSGFPTTDNPSTGKPSTENPTQISIEKLNTQKSITDGSITDSLPFRGTAAKPPEPKRRETMSLTEMESYRELILENIEYDCLKQRFGTYREDLDEIVELLVETVCAKRKTTRIAGADFPHEVVRSRFLKLDSSHIEFVMDCLQKNTTEVRNMKQYLLTVLFNAPTTMSNHYTSQVNHDMYGGF